MKNHPTPASTTTRIFAKALIFLFFMPFNAKAVEKIEIDPIQQLETTIRNIVNSKSNNKSLSEKTLPFFKNFHCVKSPPESPEYEAKSICKPKPQYTFADLVPTIYIFASEVKTNDPKKPLFSYISLEIKNPSEWGFNHFKNIYFQKWTSIPTPPIHGPNCRKHLVYENTDSSKSAEINFYHKSQDCTAPISGIHFRIMNQQHH